MNNLNFHVVFWSFPHLVPWKLMLGSSNELWPTQGKENFSHDGPRENIYGTN